MEYLSSDKIAVVDLTTGEVDEDELSEDLVTNRIGGVGITSYLYKQYEEDDPLVLGTGLLTGTFVPGGSLGIMTAKSPRTGTVCHAPFCLYAGMEMKYAGFDYLVIKGKSDKPVYLWLHDGIVDINDADAIMEMSPWEIADIKKGLRSELGDELIQFLSVGKAAENGSDLAQVLINCWSSGDRWGFGKIFGDKGLKTIAMRGMGLLEIAEPETFVADAMELIGSIAKGPALTRKGCIEFPGAMGKEEIKEWISPFVHRHMASFNTPYPYNTFVKFDEDPKVLKESPIEEPGVLITDIEGLMGFKNAGLNAEDSCRMVAACNRYGIDPVCASELLAKSGINSLEAMEKGLADLQGPVEGDSTGLFSPWAPPVPLFADFGGEKDHAWWERRQAVAYIFGIDPVFALMAPELTEEKLIELVNLGTDLEITTDILDEVISSVMH